MRCDFCSRENAQCYWEYPTIDFGLLLVGFDDDRTDAGSITWNSRGNWIACGICHEFIERGAIDELWRSNPLVTELPQHDQPYLIAALKELYQKFLRSRQGEAHIVTHVKRQTDLK